MKTIQLTQGQVTLVDDEDYERLAAYKWCANWGKKINSYYAVTRIRVGASWRTVRMHRFILDAKPGEHVDHANHDTLDNRRANIRLVTRQENNQNMRLSKRNTRGYCGVHLQTPAKKWRARIVVKGRLIHLGYFATKSSSITARHQANLDHGFHPNHGVQVRDLKAIA